MQLNLTAVGIVLTVLAASLPATAYHTTNGTWTKTNADALILCESSGPFDGFNTAPAAHGGLGGLCYMTATPGTCTPNADDPTIPNEVEQPGSTCTPPASIPAGCATFVITEDGTGLGDTIEDTVFPTANANLGSAYQIINGSPAGAAVQLSAEDSPEAGNGADFQYSSGSLFGNAEDDGVCINCNYSLVADSGHVSAFLSLLVLEFHVVPSVPAVVELALDELILPGDSGAYTVSACSDPPAGWCDDSADAFGNPAGLAFLDEETGSDGLCVPSDLHIGLGGGGGVGGGGGRGCADPPHVANYVFGVGGPSGPFPRISGCNWVFLNLVAGGPVTVTLAPSGRAMVAGAPAIIPWLADSSYTVSAPGGVFVSSAVHGQV
jgi:hypothetical protein